MTNPNLSSATGPRLFTVVVNHEDQYALWPVGKRLPDKWRESGMTGTRDECAAYIRRVWTDMRPLSARRGSSCQ